MATELQFTVYLLNMGGWEKKQASEKATWAKAHDIAPSLETPLPPPPKKKIPGKITALAC